MPKINLLYVITKLELGGAQKQLLSLISRIDKERFSPFLFTAGDGLLVAEAQSIENLKIKKSRFLERPINPFKDILALIEIYRFIKKNKIEIVHTHSSKAGILGRWAARLAKVKFILHTVHSWSFNDYQPLLVRGFFIWLEKLTAKFTYKLIVVSDHDKQKGLQNRIGDERKYHLIRYGINYNEFNTSNNIRKKLGIDNNDLVVGMVSCFKPQKSPLDFIKLASLINQLLPDLEVKFLLTGDGILLRQIEKLIFEFGLQQKVILAGWRKDIPEILSAIDIFVLTSSWEGLPVSVLEAMAASKPVVATYTGGISEIIVEGETGFLVPRRSPDKMAEKLIPLLKDEDLQKSIGLQARHSLGPDFTLENMVKNTQNLYENLIQERLCYAH